MAPTPDGGPIKELAGGWITERTGTPVPLFLKLTYVVFCLFGPAYLFLYTSGDPGHPARGPHVAALNAAIGPAPAVMVAVVAALLLAYAAGLLWVAFRRGSDED